jgi:hypothetical protein
VRKTDKSRDIDKMVGLWKLRQSIADAHLTTQNRILNEIENSLIAARQEREKSEDLLKEISSGSSSSAGSGDVYAVLDEYFLDRLDRLRGNLQSRITAHQNAAEVAKRDVQAALRRKYTCVKRQTTWDETKRVNDKATGLLDEQISEETF